MKKSTNYGFNLPEANDFYNIEHMNANFAEVDKKLKEHEDGTTTVGNANKLGGFHAHQLQIVGSDDIPINAHYLVAKHNVDNDNRFKLITSLGNDVSVANADTVDGLHASEFAKSVDFFSATDFSFMQNRAGNNHYRLQLHHGVVDLWESTDGGATWTKKAEWNTNYLPLSGGEITGDDIIPLILKCSNDGDVSVLGFSTGSGMKGYLGFNGVNTPVFYNAQGGHDFLLHTGNVGDYAIKKNDIGGQTISAPSYTPFNIQNTYPSSTGVMMGFSLNGTAQGGFGFEQGYAMVQEKGAVQFLYHTGNSNAVKIQETAPSDTSALWVW